VEETIPQPFIYGYLALAIPYVNHEETGGVGELGVECYHVYIKLVIIPSYLYSIYIIIVNKINIKNFKKTIDF
jgi:hypothetical protein